MDEGENGEAGGEIDVLGDGLGAGERTLRYSSNPIFLLPSLSMALNMSSAAFPRFVLFRALRSSARSISPLPSTSASSNTALSTKISFLLYFFSVLESSLDGMASASAPGTACSRAPRPSRDSCASRRRACRRREWRAGGEFSVCGAVRAAVGRQKMARGAPKRARRARIWRGSRIAISPRTATDQLATTTTGLSATRPLAGPQRDARGVCARIDHARAFASRR